MREGRKKGMKEERVRWQQREREKVMGLRKGREKKKARNKFIIRNR